MESAFLFVLLVTEMKFNEFGLFLLQHLFALNLETT
jgi:hypothetical protein